MVWVSGSIWVVKGRRERKASDRIKRVRRGYSWKGSRQKRERMCLVLCEYRRINIYTRGEVGNNTRKGFIVCNSWSDLQYLKVRSERSSGTA